MTRMRRFVLPLLILSAAGIGYACSGDDIVISGSSGGTDDGGSSSGSTTSSGGSSGGSSSGDSSTCTPTCKDANTFLGCDGVEKNCVLGCLTTGTPHCGAFDPTGPATAADLSEDGLMDLALENLELDTTNGRMLRAATE